jgi:hypothetical protein
VAIAARLMSLLLKLQSTEASMSLIRSEILDVELSKNSVIALNGLLYDPPDALLEPSLLQEILSLSLSAAQSYNVTLLLA